MAADDPIPPAARRQWTDTALPSNPVRMVDAKVARSVLGLMQCSKPPHSVFHCELAAETFDLPPEVLLASIRRVFASVGIHTPVEYAQHSRKVAVAIGPDELWSAQPAIDFELAAAHREVNSSLRH